MQKHKLKWNYDSRYRYIYLLLDTEVKIKDNMSDNWREQLRLIIELLYIGSRRLGLRAVVLMYKLVADTRILKKLAATKELKYNMYVHRCRDMMQITSAFD